MHTFASDIESRVVVRALGIDDTWLMRPRDHPKTPVVDCCVIQGYFLRVSDNKAMLLTNPYTTQGSVSRGYVVLILMPCLAWLTWAFDKYHRLGVEGKLGERGFHDKSYLH